MVDRISSQRTTRTRGRAAAGTHSLIGTLIVVALAAGVLLGLLSIANDGWPWWAQVFNLGAPWVVTASIVGYVARSTMGGALAGLTTLVTAVAVYYAGGLLIGAREYVDTATQSAQVWGALAVVAGPVFGIAGAWATMPGARRRVLAAAAISGALWGEAALVAADWRLNSVHDVADAATSLDGWILWPLVAGGLATALALPRTTIGRAIAIAAGLAIALLVMIILDGVSEIIRERGL